MTQHTSIRAIQAEIDRLQEEYHAKVRELKSEIEAIRAKRGTKIKELSFEGYFEQGRSKEPSLGPGYY